jgi:hypothetical protein
VRALVIGALGLSLIGCSHPPPPQADIVSTASPPMWVKAPHAAPDAKPVLAVNTAASRIAESRPAQVRARLRLAHRLAATPAKPATQAASSPHVPLPVSAPQRPAISAAMAKANSADAPSTETKPAPEPKAIQQLVAVATAAAEQLILPAPPKAPAKESAKEGIKEGADRTEPARHGDAAKATPTSSDNPDLLVAVLMARPDTRSVSDLAGKTVAIDDRYAKSGGTVRTAIVAAGAPEVQLSGGSTTAINRLTNGEVPAAVVALLSPEAAGAFPDIKGFKIFHVPLSPRAARAR